MQRFDKVITMISAGIGRTAAMLAISMSRSDYEASGQLIRNFWGKWAWRVEKQSRQPLIHLKSSPYLVTPSWQQLINKPLTVKKYYLHVANPIWFHQSIANGRYDCMQFHEARTVAHKQPQFQGLAQGNTIYVADRPSLRQTGLSKSGIWLIRGANYS